MFFSSREVELQEHFSNDCWKRNELKRNEYEGNVRKKKGEKRKKEEGTGILARNDLEAA